MARFATFTAAIAATLAFAATTLGATGARVVGAGAFEGGAGHTRVAVHAFGSGSGVHATGRVQITTDLWKATIDVTCLAHVGDRVLVGGIVTETTAPAGPGWGAAIVIEDRGPSGGGPRDRLGFGFEPPPPTTSVDCSVDPTIFPLATIGSGNFVT